MHEIETITLSLPLRMGTVNCYLVQAGSGYVLIDTGSSNQRAALERALKRAGCTPGALDLVVLTHGDFDHAGNAAYLGKTYRAPIAMHADDAGMVERGDMFWNRQSGSALLRWLSPILFGFGRRKRFSPDLHLADGSDLAAHGFEARIVGLPGHSKGSIGILTAAGDLFCGDLLENTTGPALNGIMDDPATARASVERLAGMGIRTVYPGHGSPFSLEMLGQV